MTVYKVRYFVNKHHPKKSPSLVLEVYKEEIVVDKLDTAKSIYQSYLNDAKMYQSYGDYQGKVELFVPHMFESGTLAYWPDGEQYVDQFEFDNR